MRFYGKRLCIALLIPKKQWTLLKRKHFKRTILLAKVLRFKSNPIRTRLIYISTFGLILVFREYKSLDPLTTTFGILFRISRRQRELFVYLRSKIPGYCETSHFIHYKIFHLKNIYPQKFPFKEVKRENAYFLNQNNVRSEWP